MRVSLCIDISLRSHSAARREADEKSPVCAAQTANKQQAVSNVKLDSITDSYAVHTTVAILLPPRLPIIIVTALAFSLQLGESPPPIEAGIPTIPA